MVRSFARCALLCLATIAAVHAQTLSREQLLALEIDDSGAEAQLLPFQARAYALTEAQASALRAELESDPQDIDTRLVLLHYELPEARRRRGEEPNPRAHGKLVLGLIEQHPRSSLASSAGLLLYAYKNDGLYTGPAWDLSIELWERLATEHPKDAAIACHAGLFLISDPFRLLELGSKALPLLLRARTLEPKNPRWALKLASYYVLQRQITRDPKLAATLSTAALSHLQAAFDLSAPAERRRLRLLDEPVSMVLAQAHFDVGDTAAAGTSAAQALADEDRDAPSGEVVFHMNTLLGRLAVGRGDWDAAEASLRASGTTRGSPILATSGPDLTLAKALLAHGRREAVLQFLEACRKFWTSGAPQLDTWTAALRNGQNPW